MDFRNGFPTMSHEMVSAALGLMCILFLYIRLILHLLRAPYLYSAGKGYVPGVYHHLRHMSQIALLLMSKSLPIFHTI